MRRIPFALQIASMFGLIIFLCFAVIGGIIFEYNLSSEEFNNLVNHTTTRTFLMKGSENNFAKALNDMRGFLLYSDTKYEREYRREMQQAYEDVKKFNESSTLQDTKTEGQKLEALLLEYINFGEKVIAAKKNNDPNMAAITSQGRALVEKIGAQYETVVKIQEGYLTSKSKTLRENTDKTIFISVIASGIILIIVIIIGLWFSRKTSRRLNTLKQQLSMVGALDLTGNDIYVTVNDEIGDMAEVITSMRKSLKAIVAQLNREAETLAAASEELSATVEEQLTAFEIISQGIQGISADAETSADSIGSLSSALEEISAKNEEINSTAVQVNNNTNNAVEDAHGGMHLLESVVEQNIFIDQAMTEITKVTTSLAQGSENIKNIVNVIHGIAGQTNLLALNAAIEAARAGEAGKGFAVVADEVRKLAEQSARATTDIEAIINSMGHEINQAVSTVSKANAEVLKGKDAAINTKNGFANIIHKLDNVKMGIEQIVMSIDETARGTQVMVGNMEDLNRVAQNTSANTQTAAASIEEQTAGMNEINNNAQSLAKLAEDLNSVVKQFKV